MIPKSDNLRIKRFKFNLSTSISLILNSILMLMLISSFSCKKEEQKAMMVINDSISDISYRTATATATIIDPGKGIEQHGHCWSY